MTAQEEAYGLVGEIGADAVNNEGKWPVTKWVELLMSWHLKHTPQGVENRPQVTREAVEQVFNRYGYAKPIPGAVIPVEDIHKASLIKLIDGRIVDDLLALLNGELTWCDDLVHIGNDRWFFVGKKDGKPTFEWLGLVCPICGATRP